METVKRLVVSRTEGREGQTARTQRVFRAVNSETILHDTIMVDTCHYTLVKTH